MIIENLSFYVKYFVNCWNNGRVLEKSGFYYDYVCGTNPRMMIFDSLPFDEFRDSDAYLEDLFRRMKNEPTLFNVESAVIALNSIYNTQLSNPFSTAKNNYAAWQESIGNHINNIVLARTTVNTNSYSYYLLKPNEKLVHRIDPFLQEQGCHIRIICALRSLAQNNTTASVRRSSDHIKIRLNAMLPLYESVQMESYAWPVRSINDRLEWEMGHEIWNYLKPQIEALDILITEE